MTRAIKFTKMHGAGNDYIYVDTTQYPISHPEELARAWSAPHTGIGSDGLVLIGSSNKADFSMRIFNADGSEARMCGNASRCIGKYLFDYGLTSKTEIALDTLSGIRMLNLHLADGKVNSVTGRLRRQRSQTDERTAHRSGRRTICRDHRIHGKPTSGNLCQ